MRLNGLLNNARLKRIICKLRFKCTLANWTGITYKIPRTELDRCKGRGVYFLFGTSDETEEVVYIGQAWSS